MCIKTVSIRWCLRICQGVSLDTVYPLREHLKLWCLLDCKVVLLENNYFLANWATETRGVKFEVPKKFQSKARLKLRVPQQFKCRVWEKFPVPKKFQSKVRLKLDFPKSSQVEFGQSSKFQKKSRVKFD